MELRSALGVVPFLAAAAALSLGLEAASAQSPAPWADTTLSPDARASALQSVMSLDDKIILLHGHTPLAMAILPPDTIWSSGFVPGLPKWGLPSLRETDAGLGVTDPLGKRADEGATVLPSGLAQAATWNPELVREGGAMLGAEAHAKGFNVVLAGGINLTRDPRDGRNFEYAGEDPLLAGVMVGNEVAGIQSQFEISTLKHYAFNDQETGRFVADAAIDPASARESDLLAFEIAIEQGDPGSIMCAYNRVDGMYACENSDLLHNILKREWHFQGWVMSDWGATHSTETAVLSGLDQESGEEFDGQVFFAQPLKNAVLAGRVPKKRLEMMVHRILRTMFAKGVVDHPAAPSKIDFDSDATVSERIAEQAVVLLKNSGGQLPLAAGTANVAVIGGHADQGVLSGGGGSSEVVPHGGNALSIRHPEADFEVNESYVAPSPLKAISERLPNAHVDYTDGSNIDGAVAAAKAADVAVVFATQWTSESVDAANLSLPDNQDSLIAAVAAANPHTVVVLETSGPVLMPWLDRVAGVLEAWYPGSRGADAIARVLFGEIDPSSRLPITFPVGEAQLPRTYLPGYQSMLATRQETGNPHASPPPFAIDYYEGANVGYRWYETRKLVPLFPFGFGLSYTTFAYGNLKVEGGKTLTISFDVTNAGTRAGWDTPQVYADRKLGDGHSVRHLVGWSKLALNPGETKRVQVAADPRLLANFDSLRDCWNVAGGIYEAVVARYAGDAQLTGEAEVAARQIPP